MSQVRVALDVTPLVGPLTGVARFTAAVLPHLLADEFLEPRGWVLSARGGYAPVPAGLDVHRVRLPARVVHRLWATGSSAGSRLLGPHDVVHGTNYAAPPSPRSVISVHDLTPLESSDLPASLRGRARLIRRAAADGAHLVVPSDHIRNRLIAALGADPSLVTTVAYGVDPIPPADPGAGRRRAGADRYVLALGTVTRRKNLVRLVDAVGDLPTHIGIVVAGPAGDDERIVTEALQRVGTRRVARRLFDVDELARAELLRDADVLAYPSLDEGFGFPPLEAMSVGVPVVAAAAGSIPEIVGDGAVLFDPRDTTSISRALERVINGDDRAVIVDRGREVAAGYEWAGTAAGLCKVYRRTADRIR